jgi:hypothetical protein
MIRFTASKRSSTVLSTCHVLIPLKKNIHEMDIPIVCQFFFNMIVWTSLHSLLMAGTSELSLRI